MTCSNENQPEQPRDFYQVIGVSKESTASEIRKAYYKLSRKCHPDKNGGCPEATKQFQSLAEAYETLSDDEKRTEYDHNLLMEAASKEQQERWEAQAGAGSYGANQDAYQAWYAYQQQQQQAQQQQAAAEMERMMMLQFLEQQRQAAILQQYLAAELQRQQQEQVAELLRQEQEKQRAQEEEQALLQELELLEQREVERQARAAREKDEQDRIRRLRQKEEAKRAVFFEPSFNPTRKSKVVEKKGMAPPKPSSTSAPKTKKSGRRVLAPLGNKSGNTTTTSHSNTTKGVSVSKNKNNKNVPTSVFTHKKNGTEQAVFCVKKDGTPCGIGRRMGCVCSKHKGQSQPQFMPKGVSSSNTYIGILSR